MFKKIIFVLTVVISFVSCQFSETMVINEDGSGRMSVNIDMSEMMAMMPSGDSTVVAMDSIMSFKQMFEEKKDSIAKLPKEEQERLKLLENYKMRIVMDPETNKMVYEIFTDFSSVEEANNLMQGLSASGSSQMSSTGSITNNSSVGSSQEQATAVKFDYNDNVFSRDGYIKDKELFEKQKDSLLQLEAFLGDSFYSIKYTFPKKIKKTSIDDAKISADGKTVTFKRPFLDYLKNPDALDVEIVLEEN